MLHIFDTTFSVFCDLSSLNQISVDPEYAAGYFSLFQVIYLQAFVFVILMGKLLRKIFFGQLRAAEMEVSGSKLVCDDYAKGGAGI